MLAYIKFQIDYKSTLKPPQRQVTPTTLYTLLVYITHAKLSKLNVGHS